MWVVRGLFLVVCVGQAADGGTLCACLAMTVRHGGHRHSPVTGSPSIHVHPLSACTLHTHDLRLCSTHGVRRDPTLPCSKCISLPAVRANADTHVQPPLPTLSTNEQNSATKVARAHIHGSIFFVTLINTTKYSCLICDDLARISIYLSHLPPSCFHFPWLPIFRLLASILFTRAPATHLASRLSLLPGYFLSAAAALICTTTTTNIHPSRHALRPPPSS
ncbi:hypothetical protein C8Q76DRAFT_747902 [Earliella scabrosa]|nr:hypothetical protein C8Q76DRAFT_747902 [Earliella scabrosa]